MRDQSTWLNKWKQNTLNAGPAYNAGIDGYTGNPMAVAATRVDAQVAGVQAAAASGKTAARLNSVTRDQWATPAKTMYAQRIASGVAKGAPKQQRFIAAFAPFLQNAVQQLNASNPRGPRGSQQNRQRQAAWFDLVSQFHLT